jgi:hypothetical protein
MNMNKEEDMAAREMITREFYTRYMDNLIQCPFQPGNLKISEQACLKRKNAAEKRLFEPRSSEDLFNYCVSQNLIRCEKCAMTKKGPRKQPARVQAVVH